MLLDIRDLAAHIGWVLLVLAAFVVIKAFVVVQLARAFRHETGVAIRAGVMLAQGGEFGFVLLALGAQHRLLDSHTLQLVLAASLLSMVLAPFIIQYSGRLSTMFSRSYERRRERWLQGIAHIGSQLNGHVIICGFGRSGQYLSRFLIQENLPFIAIDIDLERVREAAAAVENVVYGDAGRRVVLQAAGVERAKALIISYDDMRSTMKILHVMQESYPLVPVIVRTVDDSNMEKLLEAGAAEVVPEVLEGSLMLASHALVLLGVPLSRVVKRIRQFRGERYQLFRGFFHGLSDYDLDARDEDQLRLHSVPLSVGAYACGMRLLDLQLENYEVEIRSIRRPNSKGLDPQPHVVLAEGDMVVLQGTPDNLARADRFLLTGK
jgi:CPA2 family monovalent cation:H+ antiporter-2